MLCRKWLPVVTVEIPEIAEKNDSPVESEPVEETVAPVETVASEEVNEERVEVIKTAGPLNLPQ